MQYKNSNEMAKQWHVSPRTVRNYCIQNKIPGAVYSGKQWLIPFNASPPLDGRTKAAQDQSECVNYHFPVFIFTQHYSNPIELSDDERKLLEAQKLHLQGKYYDSIAMCRNILNHKVPAFISAGAHFTIGFSATMLGLSFEHKNSLSAIKKIAEEESVHQEDFKLMAAYMEYHTTWDGALPLSINPTLLTHDAIILYKSLIVFLSLLNGTIDKKTKYNYMASELILLEYFDITPAIMVMHLQLASAKFLMEREEYASAHAAAAIKIAVENNWIPYLAKFYTINSALLEKVLEPFGHKYVEQLKKTYDYTIKNWQLVRNFDKNIWYAKIGLHLYELLFLLSLKYSQKKISLLLDMPTEEIKKSIAQLYEYTGTSTLEDLIAYAQEVMANDYEKNEL